MYAASCSEVFILSTRFTRFPVERSQHWTSRKFSVLVLTSINSACARAMWTFNPTFFYGPAWSLFFAMRPEIKCILSSTTEILRANPSGAQPVLVVFGSFVLLFVDIFLVVVANGYLPRQWL